MHKWLQFILQNSRRQHRRRWQLFSVLRVRIMHGVPKPDWHQYRLIFQVEISASYQQRKYNIWTMFHFLMSLLFRTNEKSNGRQGETIPADSIGCKECLASNNFYEFSCRPRVQRPRHVCLPSSFLLRSGQAGQVKPTSITLFSIWDLLRYRGAGAAPRSCLRTAVMLSWLSREQEGRPKKAEAENPDCVRGQHSSSLCRLLTPGSLRVSARDWNRLENKRFKASKSNVVLVHPKVDSHCGSILGAK